METILFEIVLSLYNGFAIFILVMSIPFFKGPAAKKTRSALTESSVIIIRVVALVFLALWIVNVFRFYQVEEDRYVLLNRMFGPYWFGYWMYPFCYGILPQILWLKELQRRMFIRILIALLLLFALYFERMIIWITSMHRDYVPSNWTLLPNYFIVDDFFIDVLIFGIALTIVYLLRRSRGSFSEGGRFTG